MVVCVCVGEFGPLRYHHTRFVLSHTYPTSCTGGRAEVMFLALTPPCPTTAAPHVPHTNTHTLPLQVTVNLFTLHAMECVVGKTLADCMAGRVAKFTPVTIAEHFRTLHGPGDTFTELTADPMFTLMPFAVLVHRFGWDMLKGCDGGRGGIESHRG